MSEPVRILVVDDDPMQLELVERVLARDGFDVRCAMSMTELVEHARAMSPQLILIDVNMPDAPGDAMVAAARAACASARIILYSSWDAARLRAIAAQLGADGFISKSESAVTIAKKLRELVTK